MLHLRLLLFMTLGAALTVLSADCDSTKCVLPDCLCMNTSAPNGLDPQEIPQMVFLTFDDAVADWNYHFYERILGNRTNPNGCNITMTFYVSHDGTNYQLVNELFNRGNEIASHSVTHKNDYSYWTNSSVSFWEREAGRQREIINTYGNIPLNSIQGFRAPYLQTGGDATFAGLQSLAMSFDSSLPTVNYIDPPIWPFTMDYGVTHDCVIPPCSNETHSGFWDVPMVAFKSSENGSLCSMADSCFADVASLTSKMVYDYFMFNFERYKENRTPFGIYQHIYWFLNNEATLEGFLQFLDYLGTLDYVYIITVGKGIEWIKNPKKLSQMIETDVFGCDSLDFAPCPEPQVCTYQDSMPGGERTMGSCASCPIQYPWLLDEQDRSPCSASISPSISIKMQTHSVSDRG